MTIDRGDLVAASVRLPWWRRHRRDEWRYGGDLGSVITVGRTARPLNDRPSGSRGRGDQPDARVARPSAHLQVQRVRPAYRQVADELRRQILGGSLSAGERLPNEAELCRAFGVSRSTVREALRVLSSQHLIETTRGVQGGSFVAAPDPAQVVEDIGSALGVLVMTPDLGLGDLLEARLMLEPPAARLAAQRADVETVQAVQQAACAPRDSHDPSGLVGHLDFHTTILMATGNLMLTLMGQPVNDVLRTRLRRVGVEAEEWDKVDEHHRAIAEHIVRGEAAEAEEAMREHLIGLRTLYRRDGLWTGSP